MTDTANIPASPPPGSAPVKKPRWLAALVAIPVLAAGFAAWQFLDSAPARDFAKNSQLRLDLARPDALIESTSLAKLPADLLKIPVLRDTLTEDFVFHYEYNADRMGLAGSLRRIAYEHDLEWQDTLINELLDEPATVALWRERGGKLAHFMLVIKRNGFGALMQGVAKAALDDSQLGVAGLLHVDGEDYTLYRLRIATGRTLLFAGLADRFVVLSDPGMLLASAESSAKMAESATETLESVLDGDESWQERFGLTTAATGQRITLGADYLSMGYRAFFPALAGMQLEKQGDVWTSRMAFSSVDDAAQLDFNAVWATMPMGASACAGVPLSSALPGKLLQRLGATPEQQEVITSALSGPVGVCWYPTSNLHSPLVVARLAADKPAAVDAVAGELFAKVVGSFEAGHEEGRFPVVNETLGDGSRWQRIVGSRFGNYPADRAEDAASLSSPAFFQVTLARRENVMMFSVDDSLVKQAIATQEKRYPPLAETLPRDVMVPLYVAPESLAPLLRQEALKSLPKNDEPVFRNAAETYLLPRLDALARYGKFAATLPRDIRPEDEWQWIDVKWQSL